MTTPDPQTIQAANDFAKHAESYPITIGFFSLIAMIGCLGFWLLFRFWPTWREEQEKNRTSRENEQEKNRAHIAGLVASVRQEAKDALEAERSAAATRHKELTDGISGNVAKLSEKVDENSRRLGLIAAKLGIGILLILCVAGGAAGIIVTHAKHRAYLAAACDPPCNEGYVCCTQVNGPRKCCKESSTAHEYRENTLPALTTQPDAASSVPPLPAPTPAPAPSKPTYQPRQSATTYYSAGSIAQSCSHIEKRIGTCAPVF